MTRREKWTAAALAGCLAAGAVWVAWPRGPYPCRATFMQVREGMTRGEVVATVGHPPAAAVEYEPVWDKYSVRYEWKGWARYEAWEAADARLVVAFDASDRVAAWQLTDLVGDQFTPGLLARFRARLGL